MLEVRPVPPDGTEVLRALLAGTTMHGARHAQERGITRPGLLDLPAQNPSFRVLGAFEAGAALGYTVIRREGRARDGMIYDLFVAPPHRRRGVGERLLRAALDLFRSEGCVWARLNVDIDNTAAFRLYERLGFRVRRHEMHIDLGTA